MKIYTKKGDTGQTSLLGGTRVEKHHDRIEAYGTVDELNSHIGLIRDLEMDASYKKHLTKIQNDLFTIGSILASDPDKSKVKIPSISEEDIAQMESAIDEWMGTLPEMRSFILPGGHPTVSQIHIARCVCRRAERAANRLKSGVESAAMALKYLNRLSDYLFMLARKMTADLNADEIPWKGMQ
ncbi:MAG: cob(I)yrinic acid a,c-diamide adenosyltransferase [Flavobacteriales bacterium]|nr:cob(I)yrinic acid a,c-diamide adenosyltransferase [Flavobacteriales bacterium]